MQSLTKIHLAFTIIGDAGSTYAFARLAELTARNAAGERAALQLEAAQVTARAVAHNLNQPLAIIRGYAELLRDAPVDDLSRVLLETDRAAAMVRQLLQIVRYETTP